MERVRECRPIDWIPSSEKDSRAFPADVQDQIIHALHQVGTRVDFKPRASKPLKGVGSGVWELVSPHDGDTFRTVYTVRFRGVVYVLHAFQKKAKKGIATPRKEIDLIKRRLKRAEQDYATSHYARTSGGG